MSGYALPCEARLLAEVAHLDPKAWRRREILREMIDRGYIDLRPLPEPVRRTCHVLLHHMKEDLRRGWRIRHDRTLLYRLERAA